MAATLWLSMTVVLAQEASVIKEITIRGNRRVQMETITGVMRTKVGQPYIQANLDADKRSIEDLGFFSAVFVRPTALDGGNWSVTVDVEEFPEIKEIRVTGNTVLTTDEILRAITLRPGQVFNLNALAPSSNAIRDAYTNKGFFGTVTEFAPDPTSPGTINLTITELKVGNVSVVGNTRTRDWVMRRLIKTRSGEAFSIEKWSRDLRRVVSTGFFEPGSIKPTEDTERELGKIDLAVEVKEARTGRFNVGLQIDPRASVAGLITLAETNLNGTGQSVALDYLQTTQGGGASVGLEYLNPFWDNRDTSFSASVYSRIVYRFAGVFGSTNIDNEGNYNERRTGGAIGFARPVNDNLTYGISARYEAVRTNNLPQTIDPNAFIRQDGSVGAVALTYTLDRRDLPNDASRGDWIRFEVEPGVARIDKIGGAITDTSLLGTKTFGKAAVEYRRYFTDQPPRSRQEPDASRRVLAVRFRYATIGGTVPFFEQYFAGGANTIRGYDEDRFWGKQLLISTVEYRYPIQKAFNAIAFVDYGGAWGGFGSVNNFSQSRTLKLHLGYGVGLSFRTPLGPIRVDLGFNEEGRTRTHFLIGTSF